MSDTNISWATVSFNPFISGCVPVSRGCDNCYAQATANVLTNNPNEKVSYRYRNVFEFTVHNDLYGYDIKRWQKLKNNCIVFMGSMTDYFQGGIPDRVYELLDHGFRKHDDKYYLLLTKRPARMLRVIKEGKFDPPENVGLGTTIESYKYMRRAEYLAQVKNYTGAMTFVSYEPAVGPFIKRMPPVPLTGHRLMLHEQDLSTIDWLITGGESGSDWREPSMDWFREARDWATRRGIAFHHKQHGGNSQCWHESHKAKGCRLLDGVLWDQYPTQIREWLA